MVTRERARVDGVFDQLLDDRGRALDHFAGGNLIGEIVGQPRDATHRFRAYNQPRRRNR